MTAHLNWWLLGERMALRPLAPDRLLASPAFGDFEAL